MGLADALLGKGREESGSGSDSYHAQAKQDWNAAETIYTQLKYSSGVGGVLLCLADNENNIGELSEARGHYKQAQEIFSVSKHRLYAAEVLVKMADLDAISGHLDIAKLEYGEGRKIYSEIGADWGEANGLVGLAAVIIAGDMNDKLDAERISEMYSFVENYYDEAEKHVIEGKFDMQKVNLLVGRSYALARNCHFSEAGSNLNKADKFFYDMGNLKGQGEIEIARGFLARAMRDGEGASKHFSYAVSMFHQLKDENFQKYAELGLQSALLPLKGQTCSVQVENGPTRHS